MLIQDGVLRLRWREGPLAPRPAAPLVPGEAVEVTVEIGFMSYIVNAGHRYVVGGVRTSLRAQSSAAGGAGHSLTAAPLALAPCSLRLALSSSNYKRFSLNPNTGRPLSDNTTAPRIANNAVLADADHPSALVLPVLDASRLAELRV